MDIKIIYNKYSMDGNLVGEKEYTVTSKEDYNRVMRIIEENSEEYELVNCEYNF